MRTFRFSILLLTWLVALPLPARATLGEVFRPDPAQHARPARTTGQPSNYSVHEYALDSGTVVREFAAADGVVFAVSWSGPFIPDLQQLLGATFERYVATAASGARPGRHPLLLRDPHYVIRSGGHMRAFYGVVYLPELVPAGVVESELH